jgi:hypothetical protein
VFFFCMLAVELPVILLEIIVCLFQWSLTECQVVQRPTYKRQTMISNRMTGSSTANIQKKNNISIRMTGSTTANIRDYCLSFVCWLLNCLSFC